MQRTSLLCLLILTGGCASSAPPAENPAPRQASDAAPPAFENPGGMWMPKQLAAHADTLRKLGLELSPAALTDPLAPPLAAVVSLGGCSASFVSPEGLIATNHHCVQGALQYHSTPEENLVRDGFLAKSRAEERWNGPLSRVYVTQAITDVTARVVDGLDSLDDDRERYDEIERRHKKLVDECESGRPDRRCAVSSFFRGAEHYLIERLQIRDVRLVYAPPSGVGYFGGDEDNWMWPRHTGDFAFYRAYVGKDGQPSDHAADNVPYRPEHYLKVATKPLRKGDLVMVTGYPGGTYRYRTSDEVKDAVEWTYPRQLAAFEEYVQAMQEASKTGKDTAIKANVRIVGLQNAIKNFRGTLDGLDKGGLAAQKAELERGLVAWIAADEQRQATYGQVLSEMAALRAEERKHRERDLSLGLLGFSTMFDVAETIVRMAEERPKPDIKRDPGYQERNWKRLEGYMRTVSRRYDRTLDRALTSLTLRRAAREPKVNGDWLALVTGTAAVDEATIERALERLYNGTKLEQEAVRVDLLQTATSETLRASSDPFIQLALALRPLYQQIEDRDKRIQGAQATLEPRYIKALREYAQGDLAPDANGTLRITYGTVRGYQPRADAPMHEPFTTMSQMVAKHRDKVPFDVPDQVLQAARAKRFGSYVAQELGDVPVNFLSDLDITGGNSGSPTINGRGELVGLAFDGNYESMASDWLFIPALSRTIHVDIRYALWILDAVEDADHLLAELGVTPSVNN